MVLETDAPYLVPPAFKGCTRFSNPGMLLEAAKAIASMKNVPLSFVCDTTTSVVKELYNL